MLAGPGRRRTRPLQAVRAAPRTARCGAARTAAELVPIAGYYGRLVQTQERMGLILGRGCMGLAWLDRGPAHTAKDRRGVGCPATLVVRSVLSIVAEYVDILSERRGFRQRAAGSGGVLLIPPYQLMLVGLVCHPL